jgi:hypothetical protein
MSNFTTPGKWYFVVDSLACGKPIPMAEAPSPNQRPDPLPYRVVSDLRCHTVTTSAATHRSRCRAEWSNEAARHGLSASSD